MQFDETNETPYVCFRRREVKLARKMRRTDTQTIERLVRLKSDLSSAQELLIKVLNRERCKRDSQSTEAKIFDDRIRMRDIKRTLGETDGDEALLIARREKSRKRDEIPQLQHGYFRKHSMTKHFAYAINRSRNNKIVIPNRSGLGSFTPGLPADPLPQYKDRTSNATQRVEKDMQRKREQELGWEDITDSAFLPLPQFLPSRYWRASEKICLPAQDGRKPPEVITFDHQSNPYVPNVTPRYRKRVGRGGRVLLDRLGPRTNSSEAAMSCSDSDAIARMYERWRYDDDLSTELPSTRHPVIVDDYETRFAAIRTSLVSSTDWEALYPNTIHVEEALRWTLKEPERLPPIQIIGKLPGLRASLAPIANGTVSAPVPASMPNQMLPVANRAHTSGQMTASAGAHQAARRNTSNGSASVQLPNVPLPPQQPQIRRLMWENGTTA